MPKLSEMFPSNYLKSTDFDETGKVVTIKEISIERLGQGRDAEDKYIVYFEELEKGLVLNKTNSNIIGNLFGDDTDDWEGKKISLYAAEVEFKGEMVDAIRVKSKAPKAAKATATAASKPAKPAATDEAEDDDLPF